MRRKRRSTLLQDDDNDPLSVVVNLFDVAMVFAVSLMVALVMHMNMTEVFGQEDFTIVKNPGKENMEIIMKEGKEINTYKASGEKTDGEGNQGRRIGTAYQLEDGRIIYVPDEEWVIDSQETWHIQYMFSSNCSRRMMRQKYEYIEKEPKEQSIIYLW